MLNLLILGNKSIPQNAFTFKPKYFLNTSVRHMCSTYVVTPWTLPVKLIKTFSCHHRALSVSAMWLEHSALRRLQFHIRDLPTDL